MTALNPSPAALLPSQGRSLLAPGTYPGARRLSLPLTGHFHPGFRTSNRETTRALRGRGQDRTAKADGLIAAQALEAVADAEPVNPGSAPDASSFQIVGGKPNPAGNTAPELNSSPARAHPFSSFERQTLNQTGSQCSERNEVPVRISGGLYLVGLALHRPSFDLLLQSLTAIRDWHEEFRECPTSYRSTSVLKVRKTP